MKDFLFTLLAWLLALPLIISAVVFAIYNSDSVSVIFNPFQNPVSVPLYIPILTAVAFGFLLGCLMTWAGMARQRAELREQKKRVKTLEKELDGLERTPPQVQHHNLLPSSFIGKR